MKLNSEAKFILIIIIIAIHTNILEYLFKDKTVEEVVRIYGAMIVAHLFGILLILAWKK